MFSNKELYESSYLNIILRINECIKNFQSKLDPMLESANNIFEKRRDYLEEKLRYNTQREDLRRKQLSEVNYNFSILNQLDEINTSLFDIKLSNQYPRGSNVNEEPPEIIPLHTIANIDRPIANISDVSYTPTNNPPIAQQLFNTGGKKKSTKKKFQKKNKKFTRRKRH